MCWNKITINVRASEISSFFQKGMHTWSVKNWNLMNHASKNVAKIISEEPSLRSVDRASWSLNLNWTDFSKIQKPDRERGRVFSSSQLTFWILEKSVQFRLSDQDALSKDRKLGSSLMIFATFLDTWFMRFQFWTDHMCISFWKKLDISDALTLIVILFQHMRYDKLWS